MESLSVKSRGRPRIPEQWTRVLSLDRDNLENLKTFQLAQDLLMADGVPKPKGKVKEEWRPYFLAVQFLKENPRPTAEDFKLSDEELVQLGQLVSKERARLRDKADLH